MEQEKQEKLKLIMDRIKKLDFLNLFSGEIEEYRKNTDFENEFETSMFVMYITSIVNHCVVYEDLKEYREILENKKTKDSDTLEKLNKVSKYLFSLELEKELKANNRNNNKIKI